MRYVFAVIIFLHGTIHLLGFLKAFSLAEIKELTLPITKLQGAFWLLAMVLLLLYLISYLTRNQYSWVIGLLAVILSQLLITYFWKDAKFGSIPNLLILCLSVASMGEYHFNKLVKQEITTILISTTVNQNKVVEERDIRNLPVPVQRWLMHSGIIGKPVIHVGRVMQRAKLKMKPEQETWLDATAVQYSTMDSPAFIWTVDVTMNSLLSFRGRDKFDNGKGEMLIKLNSLFSVVNERGEKMDEGSLQRYLGEMVWFPSLALSEFITWEQIDDNTAKATMRFNGTTGSGTFHFNADGDFVKFSALRFKGNEANAKRHEWVLEVQEQKVFDGVRVPSKMTATWQLDEGSWTWLMLEISDIEYNAKALTES